MFTNLKTLALLALISVRSVHAAPVDWDDIKGVVESFLDNLPEETSQVAGVFQTPAPSDAIPPVAPTDTGDTADTAVFTVVTSIGGPAITLATDGVNTVWDGATFTVADPNGDAAPTAVVGDNSTDATLSDSASASDSAVASSPTDSNSVTSVPASATLSPTSSISSASASSSGASSVSSISSSASPSGSSKPSGAVKLELSTPLARSLFTVAVGIVFGAWWM
ncbi:hypothetical protein GGX14DRAFT_438793 [Mycena pura]|uniref:Uncharacterized protein n=1 Tax=Mycena pura TaxID=153505 RepID=A0AAD6VN56_9AGAR|nr:hypothetical protein GGX14DRAFT_438793 [Mycena pura]